MKKKVSLKKDKNSMIDEIKNVKGPTQGVLLILADKRFWIPILIFAFSIIFALSLKISYIPDHYVIKNNVTFLVKSHFVWEKETLQLPNIQY